MAWASCGSGVWRDGGVESLLVSVFPLVAIPSRCSQRPPPRLDYGQCAEGAVRSPRKVSASRLRPSVARGRRQGPPPRPALRAPPATGPGPPFCWQSSAPRPPAPCGQPGPPPSPALPRRIVPAAPSTALGCCAPFRLTPALPPAYSQPLVPRGRSEKRCRAFCAHAERR